MTNLLCPNKDTALLNSLAEKSGMPSAAIDHIARELRDDYTCGLLYELEQGQEFPASTRSKAPLQEPAVGEQTIPIRKDMPATPSTAAVQS